MQHNHRWTPINTHTNCLKGGVATAVTPSLNSDPAQYHEVRLGANARINALTTWRVFQIAMSRPRLQATSTAKSISGAMHTTESDIPLLPPCQRQRPVSPGWVPLAQLAVL